MQLLTLCLTTLLYIYTVIAGDLVISVQYMPLEPCTRKTRNGDTLSVHYVGELGDASRKQFDSSFDRGKPFSFALGNGQVIRGWDAGLLGMCVGERRRLTIPPEMAYGSGGTNGIPANSVLVFETVLLGIS